DANGIEGEYSTYASGQACPPGLPAPTGLAASDGAYPDYVRVTWNPVPNAKGYRVYRNLTGNPDDRPVQTWDAGNTPFYKDYDVTYGSTYWYWARAYDSAAVLSPNSKPDSGYAGNPPAPAPGPAPNPEPAPAPAPA